MRRRSRAALAAAACVTLVEASVVARSRGSWLGVDTVVRCRRGHLFTTVWIPGVSLKAIRLGPWRLQRCPIGPHWTLVAPARVSGLTTDERQLASRHRDLRIP